MIRLMLLIFVLTICASFISPIEMILNSTSTITGGPIKEMKGLFSKESVVLRRWKQKQDHLVYQK